MPATTVGSASTVKSAPASTVESATTMESASATEAVATVKCISTADPTGITTATSITTATRVSAPTYVAAPITASVAAPPAIMTPAASCVSAIPESSRMSPVIPRTRADEHAVDEVVRAIETIRGTRVRVVVVVTVGAGWRTIAWSDGNTDSADADSESYLGL